MKLKLKPHHLDAIFDQGNAYSQMEARRHVEAMYSPEFAIALEQFVHNEITPDTEIIIISSNIDDLCNTCSCPYLQLCEAGDYTGVFTRMLNNLPPLPSPTVVYELRCLLRDGEEAVWQREIDCAKKYGLEFGESCVWKEIQIAKSTVAVQD